MSPSEAVEKTQGTMMKATGQCFHLSVSFIIQLKSVSFIIQLKSKHFLFVKKIKRHMRLILKRIHSKSWEIKTWPLKIVLEWNDSGAVNSKLDRDQTCGLY